MSKQSIKQTIDLNIYQNGQQRITGNVLNSVLNAMVDNEYEELNNLISNGFKFGGVVTPSDTPIENPIEKMFYVANQNGTYANFGGIVVNKEVAIIIKEGSESQEVIIDTSSFVRKSGYPQAAGWSQTVSANYKGFFMPVEPNTTYKFTKDGTSSGRYAFLTQEDTISAGASVSFCDGHAAPKNFTSEVTFVTPSDCNYIWIQSLYGGNDITPIVVLYTQDGTWNKYTIVNLALKQDKLVSGSNIKTINGQSVLGSGNISIQSGGDGYSNEIHNNLNTDGLLGALTLISGTYGQKGAVYGVTNELSAEKMHYVWDYRNEQKTSSNLKLFSALSNKVSFEVYGSSWTNTQGLIHKTTNLLLKSNGVSDVTIELPIRTFKAYNGNDAMFVKYNGFIGSGTKDINIEISSFRRRIGYPQAAGWSQTNNSKYQGLFLPTLPNSTYKLTKEGTSSGRYGFLTQMDTISASSPVSFCEGHSGLKTFTSETTFVTPSDCNYIWIQTTYNSNNITPNVTNVVDGVNSATIVSENNALVLKIDNVQVARVEYSSSDSIVSLYEKLINIPSISVVIKGILKGTCDDLFISEYRGDIPLNYTLSSYDGSTYDDCPYINIPYINDASWHSIEVLFDFVTKKVNVAHDGYVITTSLASTTTNTGDIQLGVSNNTYLMRNLDGHFDGYGDAELVEWYESEYGSTHPQIISVRNPKLIVFEGHGVSYKQSIEPSTGLEVSTDRLYYVFEWLKQHEYVPVTWQDIQDWKRFRKPLPKRCYNLTFDDYQLANYMNVNCRKPFNDYNVKPGLAVITEYEPMDTEHIFNGVVYTSKECFANIVRAGWYPHSHTYNDSPFSSRMASEMVSELIKDSASCNKLGIYADMITSPNASWIIADYNAFKMSPFKITCENNIRPYNCHALHEFMICRNDIAERVPLENLLKSLR